MLVRPPMASPDRGEVWLVDLGLAAKVRPCLVLSIPAAGPNDRVLATLVAHTTSARGSQFEVSLRTRYLNAGVFDARRCRAAASIRGWGCTTFVGHFR
jgi:mRNA interferase MazF